MLHDFEVSLCDEVSNASDTISNYRSCTFYSTLWSTNADGIKWSNIACYLCNYVSFMYRDHKVNCFTCINAKMQQKDVFEVFRLKYSKKAKKWPFFKKLKNRLFDNGSIYEDESWTRVKYIPWARFEVTTTYSSLQLPKPPCQFSKSWK